jgi:hypothetical protein
VPAWASSLLRLDALAGAALGGPSVMSKSEIL